jgi:hypothetical protein
MQNIFIHHVFFWLKEPANELCIKQLQQGLLQLSTITTITSFHIGRPAATSRSVIDNTYSTSWLLTFNSAAEQDSYQTDPIHLDFIKQYAHLWDKVVVYDSVDI